MSTIDLTRWACGSEDAARIGGTTPHTLKNWRVKNGLFKEKARGRGVRAAFYVRDVIKIAVIARMIKLGVPADTACQHIQNSSVLPHLASDDPVMLGWNNGRFVRAFNPNSDPYLCVPLEGLTNEIVDQLADGIAFKHGKAAAEEAVAGFWSRLESARVEFQEQQQAEKALKPE